MKIYLVSLVCMNIMTSSAFAYARPLQFLVRSPDVSFREYNAYLLTDPTALSIVDQIKKNPASATALAALKTEFKKAQLQYLQANAESMRDAWINLISFAYKADWPKDYREMISIGFLRLAQISLSADETKKWLTLAVSYDDVYQPDHNLFPPPLVAEFNELREHEQTVQIPTDNFAGFEWLFVNGRPIHIIDKRFLSLPDQTVRLTLVSSKYETVSRVMPARDILRFKPRTLPWVTGSCQSPIWSAREQNHAVFAALFHDSCIAVEGLSQPVYALNASSLANVPTNDVPSTAGYNRWSDPSITTSIPPSSASQPFYKSGWFWFGASVAAGAIIYAQARNANSTSGNASASATHTSGF